MNVYLVRLIVDGKLQCVEVFLTRRSAEKTLLRLSQFTYLTVADKYNCDVSDIEYDDFKCFEDDRSIDLLVDGNIVASIRMYPTQLKL